MKQVTKVIEYTCPICRDSVPIAEITATRTGRWTPRIEVIVEGDATDYVIHMWAHDQRRI
jgi:hypothetical protein